MKAFSVMLLLALASLPVDAHARCDDDAARRVLSSQAVDCPRGVGITAGRAYAPDGGRYRAVYISYTDPATGITIYTQLVRGARNPNENFDALVPRYAIDVCMYGSEGPAHPIFQQIGGDESASACCNSDDLNDFPDEDATCPKPPAYMLPMAAPPGQDPELEELARKHLVETLTSDQYPWRGKWSTLRAALQGSVLNDDPATRARLAWILGDDADNARLAPGATGEVRYADGFTMAAMPDGHGMTQSFDTRSTKNWRQIVVVSKRAAGGIEGDFCRRFNTTCEHSGTYGIRRTPNTWWVYAYQRCNHGGCPAPGYANYDPKMVPWCLFDSVLYNRAEHVHNVSCHSLYDPSGAIYGHVCNDDSELQYHAVRDNYHPNNTGYPCYDIYRHWTTTPCW